MISTLKKPTMKKMFCLPLTLGLILTFCSCKKSTGGGSTANPDRNPLIGSWALTSETWKTYQSDEYTDGADLLQINSGIGTTSGTSGVFTFTDSMVTINNLNYTNTVSYADFSYKNKAITDSAVGTLPRIGPDTSMSNAYHLVGTDSVVFPQGSFILIPLRSIGSALTAQSGATFQISGNTLTITSIVNTVQYPLMYSGKVMDTVRTNDKTVAVFTKQ